jgi:ATP-dependent helicase/nuclease subunit A
LGDESVFKIMLENPDNPFPPDPPESWFSHPSEQERYEQGREIFTQLRNRIDLQSIALVLAYLWYETGYRTYLLYDENSRPNLEHFEYLYALALEADQRQLTIGAFLDELAPRIGTTDKTETGEIPELKDQVLFITVHKSKGLEFPVVILANAGAAGRGDVNDKPYFLDPEYGPVINLKSDTAKRDDKPINYFYTFLRRELTQRQEEAELKRLFYVAATRAKERLIIVGSRELHKLDEGYLVDLEGAERLRALIERGHRNSEGELQKKSFLDLFSCGILGATGPIPDYQLVPIATPTQEAYRETIKLLHKRTTALQQHSSDASPLSPEGFYALPPRPAIPAGAMLTSPSRLENYDASLRPPSPWSEQLPAFKGDRYLEVPEIEGDRIVPASPFEDQEGLEAVTAVSREDLHKKFGTLCHRMIEKLMAGNTPLEALQAAAYQEVQALFQGAKLSEQALKTLAEEALDLAQGFLNSPLGQEAASAPRCHVEFPFILPLKPSYGAALSKPTLIRGTMDLIYESQGHCVIIDFKTDRYLNPESHRVQLSCYWAAAKAFSALPVKTILVYLRNMRAVPVDPHFSAEELFELAKGACFCS